MSVKQTYLSLSVLLSSESSGQGALISLSRDSDFWQKKNKTNDSRRYPLSVILFGAHRLISGAEEKL